MAVTLVAELENHPEIAGMLAALERRAGDLSPAMEEIGAYGETATRLRFERGEGPGGAPWPPSLRARREGGQTLVLTSRLRDSIVYLAGRDQAEWGTNVIYAAIHQGGGTVRAKSAAGLRFRIGDQWVTVQAVEIPARPFLGIDRRDEESIGGILARHLAQAVPPGALS